MEIIEIPSGRVSSSSACPALRVTTTSILDASPELRRRRTAAAGDGSRLLGPLFPEQRDSLAATLQTVLESLGDSV
jgi:hypothetical protein